MDCKGFARMVWKNNLSVKPFIVWPLSRVLFTILGHFADNVMIESESCIKNQALIVHTKILQRRLKLSFWKVTSNMLLGWVDKLPEDFFFAIFKKLFKNKNVILVLYPCFPTL